MRALLVALLAAVLGGLVVLTVAPPRGESTPRPTTRAASPRATCSAAQKASRVRALRAFRRNAAARRRSFFRSHGNVQARKRFLRREKAKLTTLTRRARCRVTAPPAQPAPAPSPPPATPPNRPCSLFVAASGSPGAAGRSRSRPTSLTAAVARARAGDTVCLTSGIYRINHTTKLTRSGRAGAPITFRGNLKGYTVLRWTGGDGWIFQVAANHVDLQHLVLDGGYGSRLARSGVKCNKKHHHVAVRFSTIRNTGSSGFNATGCDYVTAEGNMISRFGSDPKTGWGSGVSLNQSSGAYWADRYAGFHSYVVGNVIAGGVDESHHHSDGNGVINDLGGNTPPVLVANNVIYMNGGRCIHVLGASHTWVVNNTCYKNRLDARIGEASGEYSVRSTGRYAATDIHFVNNVGQASGNAYPWYRANAGSTAFVQNVEWQGRRSVPPQWRRTDPLFTAPPTVAAGASRQWLQAPPPSVVGDAFRPRAGSPLIDTGVDPRHVSGMTPELARSAGRYLTRDATGAIRPRGSAFDIGAYEQ